MKETGRGTPKTSTESNRKRRTRKDLLEAAGRLLKTGTTPTLEAVAEAALVSRATAYRYFPSIDALFLEASFDVASPSPETVFKDAPADDPVLRLERVDGALHQMIVENEAPLRMMLAHALERRAKGLADADVPIRQNRRTRLIEAALAPSRKQFKPTDFHRLTKALALIIGTEAWIVFRDVLNLDDAEAAEVTRWTIRALVDAARRP